MIPKPGKSRIFLTKLYTYIPVLGIFQIIPLETDRMSIFSSALFLITYTQAMLPLPKLIWPYLHSVVSLFIIFLYSFFIYREIIPSCIISVICTSSSFAIYAAAFFCLFPCNQRRNDGGIGDKTIAPPHTITYDIKEKNPYLLAL